MVLACVQNFQHACARARAYTYCLRNRDQIEIERTMTNFCRFFLSPEKLFILSLSNVTLAGNSDHIREKLHNTREIMKSDKIRISARNLFATTSKCVRADCECVKINLSTLTLMLPEIKKRTNQNTARK